MARPEHDHSINSEPHLQNQPFSPDPTEEKSAQRLARERADLDPAEERAKHSVFDEPATLPNRESVLIDRDWSCRNCGYNLRGLMTGHPCPECGKVERYEPPRDGEQTFLEWAAAHRAHVTLQQSWLITVLLPFAAIPFALACGLLTVEFAGVVNFVLTGPVMAEMLKVAVVATLIERGTIPFRNAAQIFSASLGTALLFAVVQNVIYLFFYFKNSPIELVAYRWSVCVILHAVCTAIAARGLVPIWEQARQQRQRVSIARAVPAVAAAIVLHAAYNACVFVRGNAGYGF